MVTAKSRRKLIVPLPKAHTTTVTFSISCNRADRDAIDARAKSLGLDRSTYIVAVCLNDLRNNREFVIIPKERVLVAKP